MGKELIMSRLTLILAAIMAICANLSAQLTQPMMADTLTIAEPDSTNERYV